MDAIVFDWDGTLVDSLPAIFDANLRVLEEYGLPFDDERYRAAYVPDWRLMYQRLGVPDDALDAAGERWLELYAETDDARRSCRGSPSRSSGCRDAGFVMGLVTAGDRDVVERAARAVRARAPAAGAGLRQRRRSPRSRTRTRCSSRCASSTGPSASPRPGTSATCRTTCAWRGRRGRRGRHRVVDRDARPSCIAAGASEVYPGVAEFVDALLARRAGAARPAPAEPRLTMEPPRLHAVILADGAVPAASVLDEAWPGWDEGVALVVAADGGARHAAALGLTRRSLGRRRRLHRPRGARGARGRRASRSTACAVDKDESDTELALLAAVDAGADVVTILGALGGVRVDHALANLALLAAPGARGRELRACTTRRGARLSLLVGPDRHGLPVARELAGRVGDLVSLVPLGDSAARRRRPSGLRYPLAGRDAASSAGRAACRTSGSRRRRAISLGSGRLLVIETPANLRP